MAPSSFLTFLLCAVAASFIGVRSTPIAHQYEVRQATSSSVLAPSVSGVPPPTNVAGASGTITSNHYEGVSPSPQPAIKRTSAPTRPGETALQSKSPVNPVLKDAHFNVYPESVV
ncbi:hypothetical protein B0H19DRAFT_1271559 [Mycena capillaripes]|nr:hypothetical protein B0H19DRAFT_1271559 [Mycena capillaripes]